MRNRLPTVVTAMVTVLLGGVLGGFFFRAKVHSLRQGKTITQHKDLLIGINAHVPSGPMVDLAIELGSEALRLDCPWAQVERTKGRLVIPKKLRNAVEWCRRRGIRPLIILAYGNKHYDAGGYPTSDGARAAFVRYALEVVRAFRGSGLLVEVWNEWDIGLGMGQHGVGTADWYAALLREVYVAIKAEAPEVPIIGGALAAARINVVRALMTTGAGDWMDAFSVHPYVFHLKDASAENAVFGIEQVSREIERFDNELALRLIVTEIGWPTHRGVGGVSPRAAAAQLARLYLLLAAGSPVRGAFWYDLVDDGPDPANREHRYGLFTHGLAEKPGARAMREVTNFLRTHEFRRQISEQNASCTVMEFHGMGSVWVAWKRRRYESAFLTFAVTGPPPASIFVRYIGDSFTSEVRYRTIHDGLWKCEVPLSETPVIVTGATVTPTTNTPQTRERAQNNVPGFSDSRIRAVHAP